MESLPGGRLDGHRVERVVVVLEGAARAGADERAGPVTVRHAAGSGDDLLAELCGPGVRLVTADRGLAGRARGRDAEVVGPRRLLDALT